MFITGLFRAGHWVPAYKLLTETMFFDCSKNIAFDTANVCQQTVFGKIGKQLIQIGDIFDDRCGLVI